MPHIPEAHPPVCGIPQFPLEHVDSGADDTEFIDALKVENNFLLLSEEQFGHETSSSFDDDL